MQARMISGLVTLLLMVVASAVTLAGSAQTALNGPGRAPGAAGERLEQELQSRSRDRHGRRAERESPM
jgi:hypothetical protein